MRLIILILYFTVSLSGNGPQLSLKRLNIQTIATTTTIEIKLKREYITKDLEFKVEYAAQSGPAGKRPEIANLIFRAHSHRWRFLEEENRQGVLLIEGGRFNLSPNPTYTSVIGKKFLEETLIYQVRIADLEKMARAPYLEIQIGKLDGRVSEKQLQRIKEFLMGLPGGNTK
jgi:hypothetical protein